jgi:hypothetical protein
MRAHQTGMPMTDKANDMRWNWLSIALGLFVAYPLSWLVVGTIAELGFITNSDVRGLARAFYEPLIWLANSVPFVRSLDLQSFH